MRGDPFWLRVSVAMLFFAASRAEPRLESAIMFLVWGGVWLGAAVIPEGLRAAYWLAERSRR